MGTSKLDRCYKIHVSKFDDYNKKATGKPVEWFRMDTRLARSSEYRSLSHGAKILWICLLSDAAMSSTREVYVYPKDAAREVHVTLKLFTSVLHELTTLQWIQILTTPYVRTYERTNERMRVPEKLVPPPPPKQEIKTHWVIELWNELNQAPIARADTTKIISPGRLKEISTRLKDYPDPDTWRTMFEKVNRSDFCKGKNDRGWKITFGWLMGSSKNCQKVLDGQYDGQARAPTEDWESTAQQVFNAVRRYGADETDALKTVLGEDLYLLCRKVGMRTIRETNPNYFIKTVAPLLRGAAQQTPERSPT